MYIFKIIYIQITISNYILYGIKTHNIRALYKKLISNITLTYLYTIIKLSTQSKKTLFLSLQKKFLIELNIKEFSDVFNLCFFCKLEICCNLL